MADPSIRLAAAADALAQGKPPPDPGWLSVVLSGLAAGQPAAAAVRVASTLERDHLLREIRQRHFGDMPVTRAAGEIAVAVARFEATAWRYERHKEVCPHQEGTLKSDLWQLLAIGCPIPRQRRLHDILSEMQ